MRVHAEREEITVFHGNYNYNFYNKGNSVS